jgi:hypothetical protein
MQASTEGDDQSEATAAAARSCRSDRPTGGEVPEDDFSFFDLMEEQLHEPDRAADDQGDEDDEQEVRR